MWPSQAVGALLDARLDRIVIDLGTNSATCYEFRVTNAQMKPCKREQDTLFHATVCAGYAKKYQTRKATEEGTSLEIITQINLDPGRVTAPLHGPGVRRRKVQSKFQSQGWAPFVDHPIPIARLPDPCPFLFGT